MVEALDPSVLFHIHSRRGSLPLGQPPKRQPPILSTACYLPVVGEKPVADSVVWRLGGCLLEDPHLLACVGVAPLGLELGSAQPLPWFYPGPMGDPSWLTRELLVVARAGYRYSTKCTKCPLLFTSRQLVYNWLNRVAANGGSCGPK